MRVAVVGLGEAGSIYATDLLARGASVVGTDLHVTTASAGVGIAADECGVGNGRQRGTGRASHAGQRVGIRRAHVMRVAAAMMMRIPFVGVAGDLIAVAIDVRRGFILARLDAATNLSRMRHPDPSGQDEHQTSKEGQKPTHRSGS